MYSVSNSHMNDNLKFWSRYQIYKQRFRNNCVIQQVILTMNMVTWSSKI